jgi:hypothetical protein
MTYLVDLIGSLASDLYGVLREAADPVNSRLWAIVCQCERACTRLSRLRQPAVGLDVHSSRLVCSRQVRHLVPTTGAPVPQEPYEPADRQHSRCDHRRPHQCLSQPYAPLNFDYPLLRVLKAGQLVHGLRDAPDRLGENT